MNAFFSPVNKIQLPLLTLLLLLFVSLFPRRQFAIWSILACNEQKKLNLLILLKICKQALVVARHSPTRVWSGDEIIKAS